VTRSTSIPAAQAGAAHDRDIDGQDIVVWHTFGSALPTAGRLAGPAGGCCSN
jgi:hypothetical protein